jgi:hypothetical protein
MAVINGYSAGTYKGAVTWKMMGVDILAVVPIAGFVIQGTCHAPMQ